MRHITAIAGRELGSLFVSPVAYVVLTLWSVLAGTFFLSSLIGFDAQLAQASQYGAEEYLAQMNLNDHLILPFYGSMWIVLLFLVPAVTMGLFANEKANGTDELLYTSPIRIWEIVAGKFLAGFTFVFIMTLIVGFFPGLLFFYGDPEVGKTLSGLLGLFLVSVSYVAVGALASSLTKNQLIAFVLTMVSLLVVGMMLPFIVEVGIGGDSGGGGFGIGPTMRYISTGTHFETLATGVIDTADLVYFAVVVAICMVISKAALESVRWR
ncbi:MAG: ABC-2 type transport system permease protein [Myxococcota bacterium]|jgi:ABC-2 type transport system permease protein